MDNNGNDKFIDICIVLYQEEPLDRGPMMFSIQKNRTPAVSHAYRTNYDTIFAKQERGQA